MRSSAFAVLVLLLSPSLGAQTVSTVAGSGAAGLLDGPASVAQFNRPTWLDVDAAKDAIYVVDRANQQVRRIANGTVSTLKVVTSFAGSSLPLAEFDFGGPFGGGIAVEPPLSGCGAGVWDAGFFVASSAQHQLKFVVDSGGALAAYAQRDDSLPVLGTGVAGSVDGLQSVASFNNPGDVALSWEYRPAHYELQKKAAVYIADSGNNAIRRIRFRTSFEFCPQPYFVDTLATGFNAPRGVAAAPDGSVYVADTGNHAVRRIAFDGTVTTVAQGLNNPTGIDVNELGEIFIADTGNHVIRKLTTDGQLITIAGTPGVAGYVDGPAHTAQFNGPIGVRLAGHFLYIADTANNVIRKLDLNPAPPRRHAAHH
jgi:DNA-binding beta-propeller fold protein YncE